MRASREKTNAIRAEPETWTPPNKHTGYWWKKDRLKRLGADSNKEKEKNRNGDASYAADSFHSSAPSLQIRSNFLEVSLATIEIKDLPDLSLYHSSSAEGRESSFSTSNPLVLASILPFDSIYTSLWSSTLLLFILDHVPAFSHVSSRTHRNLSIRLS